MLAKLIRPKTFVLTAVGLTILLCLYYASNAGSPTHSQHLGESSDAQGASAKRADISNGGEQLFQALVRNTDDNMITLDSKRKGKHQGGTCPKLENAEADVVTMDVFKDFEFQPTWMKSKEYWDKFFEDRFERQKMDPERPPLRVIIVPHSHNDPGWLKTFEHYFHTQSRPILSHMVAKLQQHQKLKFIWSEVAFLHAWWEGAHPSRQRALRALAQSGRVEITTGGWVMTDEANAHVYAMVDQLIEGHQWVQTNLGVRPKTGWSIDPFGHGPTVPYLLSRAGIEGTVIQRIHYAWKQWLAKKQYGDFNWLPAWSTSPANTEEKLQQGELLVHNQPFDIYSIKHSCGPHPYICLNFDFRKVAGEYTEYSIKAQTITDKNVKERSELLLEQYARTGSLFPHNVVLMPLGDDFRYNVAEEWDQQYTNYLKLIDHINENSATLYRGVNITFGTPREYFAAVRERVGGVAGSSRPQLPTLTGDFFVYSDIFSEGRPAYWSGYFTTRPFMKILSRELENGLRGAEIVYSVALNRARQNNELSHVKVLERDFEKLILARRNLGLFQHHDAITGTSKSFVMRDYGLKLFQSLRDTTHIQQNALQTLLFSPQKPSTTNEDSSGKAQSGHVVMLVSDLERDSYEKLPRKTTLNLIKDKVSPTPRQILVYNSLSHTQDHWIQLRVNTHLVKIVDGNTGARVVHQVSPVWQQLSTQGGKLLLSGSEFEVGFVVKLAGLSVGVYNVSYDEGASAESLATVFCSKCDVGGEKKSPFVVKATQPGDIQLENHEVKLLFSGRTGLLTSIFRKRARLTTHCALHFAAYRSAQFHSGAYLFMPDPNERDVERDVLAGYREGGQHQVVITSGPVSSQVTAVYGAFLTHTVRVYHRGERGGSALSGAVYIENTIDFESPPKNRETELFMRIVSDVQNGEPPVFYTDSNGFQMQKRVKVERVGIEANYYPITTQAYLQDDNVRLSLLTNHAQGAAAWQPGYLEVMLDRRTLYDDSRGMGEGVVDNRKTTHKFWLLLEDIIPETPPPSNSKPQQSSTHNKEQPRQRFDNTGEDEVLPSFDSDDTLRTFNQPTVENLNTNTNSAQPAAPSIPQQASNQPQESTSFSRPSLHANQMSNTLNYPPNIFVLEEEYSLVESPGLRLFSGDFPCDMHLMTLRTQPDPVYPQFPGDGALLVLHRQGYECRVSSAPSSGVSEKCGGDFEQGVRIREVKVKNMVPVTLTGTERTGSAVSDLSELRISPMALQTVNITFG